MLMFPDIIQQWHPAAGGLLWHADTPGDVHKQPSALRGDRRHADEHGHHEVQRGADGHARHGHAHKALHRDGRRRLRRHEGLPRPGEGVSRPEGRHQGHLLSEAVQSRWVLARSVPANICITLVQCWNNVEDVGTTLYKSYINPS